jgi:uncharacterized protein YigA (DUF484 family)
VVDHKLNLTAEAVADYLTEHKEFLEQHPELIEAALFSSAPKGTISLAERQLKKLQDQNRQLHEQLNALLDNAHANTALQERVHQLCLKMMDSSDLAALLEMLLGELKQEFSADEVALTLFYSAEKLDLPASLNGVTQRHADDASLRAFDNLFQKQQPVCGRLTKAQKTVLFAEQADTVESVACLPLGHAPCAGLLAIASHDANRFHADMGTVYLSFLGEVFMRALRLHGHHHESLA